MKPFVFARDSWHFWLATEFGSFHRSRDCSNICEYTREVLKGAATLALFCAAGLGILYWVAITAAWWAVVVQYGFFEEVGPVALTLIVVVFGGAAFIAEGIPRIFKRVQRYIRRNDVRYREKVKTDNFVTHAYRSWKEKTCVRVTLIGDRPED